MSLDRIAIRRDDKEPHQLDPREYTKYHGIWYARVPHADGHIRLTANLDAHEVTEHEDGTLTVSPSILVTAGDEGHRWHGFLERGVWREA